MYVIFLLIFDDTYWNPIFETVKSTLPPKKKKKKNLFMSSGFNCILVWVFDCHEIDNKKIF